MNRLFAILLVVFYTLSATSQDQPARRKLIRLKAGQTAPSFAIKDINDSVVSLDSLKGKLVIIDFFYKKCVPCVKSFPTLQKLHSKYSLQGLIVIGIDPVDDKEKDQVADFIHKKKLTYPVIVGGNDIADAYGVTGFPYLFLIGTDGKIILIQEGYDPEVEAKLEKAIKKHLKILI